MCIAQPRQLHDLLGYTLIGHARQIAQVQQFRFLDFQREYPHPVGLFQRLIVVMFSCSYHFILPKHLRMHFILFLVG